MEQLSNPQDNVAQLMLCFCIFLESMTHLILNVELHYKARGDRKAIEKHTRLKIQKQLIPTSFNYLAATIVAALLYFYPGDLFFRHNDASLLWNQKDLPFTLTALGYLSNVFFTFVRKMRATKGATADIRTTFVPNNIDYLIQRYADWFLLILGEVVMAMVETTDSKRNYLATFFGALTTILLHTLKFEAEPSSQAHGHALWRNVNNATCFSVLTQVLSAGLIALGVSYKILVADGRYGISNELCTRLTTGSLAWVLVSLELKVLTHKGLRKNWKRLFRDAIDSDVEKTPIHWPLVFVTLFKVALLAILLILPVWTNNPDVAVVVGFFVVVAVASTRIMGWTFAMFDQEIQHFVQSTKSKLGKKISLANIPLGGSSHRNSRSRSRRFDGGDEDDASSFDEDLEIATDCSRKDNNYHGSDFGSRHGREEIYDEMFEAVVLSDLKGLIATVNETALDVFGYESMKDLTGRHLSTLFESDEVHLVNDDLTAFGGTNNHSNPSRSRQRMLHGRHRDGSSFPCMLGIKQSADGKYLVCQVHDVTGMSESTSNVWIANLSSMTWQAQDTTRKHVQRVLNDRSSDSIVVLGFYGVIQGVNATLVREFGYQSKEELVGENITVLLKTHQPENDLHQSGDDYFLKEFRERFRRSRNTGGDNNDRNTNHPPESVFPPMTTTSMTKVLGNQHTLRAVRQDGSEFKCMIGMTDIEGADLLVGYIRNVEEIHRPRY
eukprot:scaffold1276_cov162-Amphora_coffeaeformis.AAC.5